MRKNIFIVFVLTIMSLVSTTGVQAAGQNTGGYTNNSSPCYYFNNAPVTRSYFVQSYPQLAHIPCGIYWLENGFVWVLNKSGEFVPVNPPSPNTNKVRQRGTDVFINGIKRAPNVVADMEAFVGHRILPGRYRFDGEQLIKEGESFDNYYGRFGSIHR